MWALQSPVDSCMGKNNLAQPSPSNIHGADGAPVRPGCTPPGSHSTSFLGSCVSASVCVEEKAENPGYVFGETTLLIGCQVYGNACRHRPGVATLGAELIPCLLWLPSVAPPSW